MKQRKVGEFSTIESGAKYENKTRLDSDGVLVNGAGQMVVRDEYMRARCIYVSTKCKLPCGQNGIVTRKSVKVIKRSRTMRHNAAVRDAKRIS